MRAPVSRTLPQAGGGAAEALRQCAALPTIQPLISGCIHSPPRGDMQHLRPPERMGFPVPALPVPRKGKCGCGGALSVGGGRAPILCQRGAGPELRPCPWPIPREAQGRGRAEAAAPTGNATGFRFRFPPSRCGEARGRSCAPCLARPPQGPVQGAGRRQRADR